MLILLLAIASADPREEVLVLPGTDAASQRFVRDVTRDWPQPGMYAAFLRQTKGELDRYCTVKVLDPLTPGSNVPRPAVRVGRGPGVSRLRTGAVGRRRGPALAPLAGGRRRDA